MEAPFYWLMVVARIIQGISSSVVWVVALALLCDTVPEDRVGQQMGLALMGFSFGLLLATPIGGILYAHFGWRAPFIFGIVAAVFDLVGRLLIIEKHEAEAWDSATGLSDAVEDAQRSITAEKSSTPAAGHGESGYGVNEATRSAVSVPASSDGAVPISLIEVIIKLGSSPRALAAFMLALTYGLVYTSEEPSLPLRLQAVWSLSSSQVGVVYIAGTAPSIFSGPLAGWMSDRFGPGLIMVSFLTLSIPWWFPITLGGNLSVFIVSIAIQSFFFSGVLSPLTSEIAAVAREIPGVGFAHCYGSFNIAYGVGSTFGPIIGGQIYDKFSNGWTILCIFAGVLTFIVVVICAIFTGEKPLLRLTDKKNDGNRNASATPNV